MIGILGGGQLGRMTALAAAGLGYRCHIYCPEADCPASQVTPLFTRAAYDDEAALADFAEAVDVVTFEFENIPLPTVEILARSVAVRPGAEVLAICQDRLREKDFCGNQGVATARYAAVDGPEALARAPARLRHARRCSRPHGWATTARARSAWKPRATRPRPGPRWPAATRTPMASWRISSTSSWRSRSSWPAGWTASWPTTRRSRTSTEGHILRPTIAPARSPPKSPSGPRRSARRLAEALDLVGLLAVEMFVTEDGEVLVNELAPRPHNSGHWTLDACVTSQFEQFVRAVLGLPLGSSDATRMPV